MNTKCRLMKQNDGMTGYNLMDVSIYNPRSVVMSMTGGYFNNCWTSTEDLRGAESLYWDEFWWTERQGYAAGWPEKNKNKYRKVPEWYDNAQKCRWYFLHCWFILATNFLISIQIRYGYPTARLLKEFINSIEDGGWEEVSASDKGFRWAFTSNT